MAFTRDGSAGGGADPEGTFAAVSRLTLAAEQAALLRGALKSGFLARCARPVTLGQLAGASGLDVVLAGELGHALVALGVLTTDDRGRFVVAPDCRPLLDDGAGSYVLAQLDGAVVRQERIGQLFAGSQPDWYWKIDAASRHAFAASVTFDPATDLARSLAGGIISQVAGWHEASIDGARYLELGCGLAGALLTYLQLYPKVTAVGVELAGDLIESARARAAALGVADRVRFVIADATAFSDPEPFDVVFWSQFFFPAASREKALANALARLRPGGLLVAPVLGTAPLDVLLCRSLGVPALTPPGLAGEFEAAGFVSAHVHETSVLTVTARKPR